MNFTGNLSTHPGNATAELAMLLMLGAALMGVGGVLAGGCTVGAGLAGIASLSIAALLALAS
ncbi:YeeE/YedE family protein, partial [Planktomarina temperata]|nr:YeeE/YedE family protein [Planktomarina temperata]